MIPPKDSSEDDGESNDEVELPAAVYGSVLSVNLIIVPLALLQFE